MAEKLIEIGDVARGLGNAVRTMKAIQKNRNKLARVTEEAKKHIKVIEKIDSPDEPKLQKLKEILEEVLQSGSKLEVWLETLGKEISEFDNNLNATLRGVCIPPEFLAEFCKKLQKICGMTQDFSDDFCTFVDGLTKAQLVATELETELKAKAEAMKNEASSKRNWGAAKSAGLVLGGVGLAALGFFTGGAAWAVAAAAAGGAVAGAGVAVGNKTAVDVKEMRKLASDILTGANQLGALAKELKSSNDRAGRIKLDENAVEALRSALEFYKTNLDKEELIVQQQEAIRDQEELIAQQQDAIQDKDARIAELEAKLRSMGK